MNIKEFIEHWKEASLDEINERIADIELCYAGDINAFEAFFKYYVETYKKDIYSESFGTDFENFIYHTAAKFIGKQELEKLKSIKEKENGKS